MADRQTPTLQEQHVRLSALVDSSEFRFDTNAVLSRYLSNTVQCACKCVAVRAKKQQPRQGLALMARMLAAAHQHTSTPIALLMCCSRGAWQCLPHPFEGLSSSIPKLSCDGGQVLAHRHVRDLLFGEVVALPALTLTGAPCQPLCQGRALAGLAEPHAMTCNIKW